MRDESIPDEMWWFSPHAEFEDFIGLGEERVKILAKKLEGRTSPYVINRLLHANKLPHGPCYVMEDPCSSCGVTMEEKQMSNNNMKEKTCTLTWREDGTALADCSNCGEGQLYDDYSYCPNCGARNIGHEDTSIIPSNIQRCPNCNAGYDPKPGVIMVKCLECGSDMWEDVLDGAVYADTDSILMLFCKKCSKIIKDPVWDEKTHGPHCPICKSTLIEKSPDKEIKG